jgi:hypothetical protein
LSFCDGNDPEVRRTLVKRTVEHGLGMKKVRPALRVALRGWLGFVEAASLDWLEHHDLDRETLRATLANALTTAMLLDPEHGLERLPAAVI